MKKISCFLLFVISMHSHLLAQKNTIIQGKIWAAPNDTITITHYPYKMGSTRVGAITNKLITSTGKFSIQMPSYNHPFYLSIVSKKFGNLWLNELFIEPGDSLMIASKFEDPTNRKDPFIHITGRNADKNELQHIWNHSYYNRRIKNLETILMEDGISLESFELKQKKNYTIIRKYWDSLKVDKPYIISPLFTKIFEKDLELKYQLSLLAHFNFCFNNLMKESNNTEKVNALYNDYQEKITYSSTHLLDGFSSDILSPDAIDFWVRKVMTDERFEIKTDQAIPAINYLKHIKKLAEHLQEPTSIALINYLYVYNAKVKDVNELFSSLTFKNNNIFFKQITQEFKEKYLTGSVIYPFQLTGVDGKKISIEAFKDKVIVLDFWFTGCVACIKMSKLLKMAKAKIESNTDIVFMSISIDREKNTWLKSVASEEYTHKGFINLYTDGEGIEHPLIKKYDISAYPRIMIIGKNNQLLTAAPLLHATNNVGPFVDFLETAAK